jgi:radical SAM superfamily enzyme YgiQ (UPF0313 family)
MYRWSLAPNPGAPPLALAYISAVLKQAGYRVTVVDAYGEGIREFHPVKEMPFYANGISTPDILKRIPEDTDLIGFSCMFSNEWIYHRRVIDAVGEKFPGVPMVAGGEHATADAEYVLRSCSSLLACVLGEGEETMLAVAEALGRGETLDTVTGLCLRRGDGTFLNTGARQRIRDLDSIPWPDWDPVPIENYLTSGVGYGIVRGRNMPMLASRGCPYKCSFCSNRQMWGKKWNIRAPEDVLAEMKHYIAAYQAESFSFYDLTAIVRRDWIVEFCDLLIAEDLGITWQMPSGTRSEALDAEVVAKLKASGCIALTYAPESGSEETLKRIFKKVHLDTMLSSLRACTQEGVFSKAHIILGFPGETPRNMAQSFWFMVRMAWAGVNDVAIYPFVPYPGSQFYDELKVSRGFPEDGEPYDLFLAFNCKDKYTGVRSWNEYLTDKRLSWLCVVGLLMFYSLQYLFRPWRFVQTWWRVFTNDPVTLAERSLDTLIRRQKSLIGSRIKRLFGREAEPAASAPAGTQP